MESTIPFLHPLTAILALVGVALGYLAGVFLGVRYERQRLDPTLPTDEFERRMTRQKTIQLLLAHGQLYINHEAVHTLEGLDELEQGEIFRFLQDSSNEPDPNLQAWAKTLHRKFSNQRMLH